MPHVVPVTQSPASIPTSTMPAVGCAWKAAAWFGGAVALEAGTAVSLLASHSSNKIAPSDSLLDLALRTSVFVLGPAVVAALLSSALWPALRREGFSGFAVGAMLGLIVPLAVTAIILVRIYLDLSVNPPSGAEGDLLLPAFGIVFPILSTGLTLPCLAIAGWMLGLIEQRP